jgi:RHH-type rel operon transcriptional repressor/antitoxin RelB
MSIITTRLAPEVVQALDRIAEARRRSRAEVVREAVDLYLEEWADYSIALDRLRDPADPVISLEELRAEMAQAPSRGSVG